MGVPKMQRDFANNINIIGFCGQVTLIRDVAKARMDFADNKKLYYIV